MIGPLLVAVAAIHIALLATQDGGVFWSPDEGGKYLQVRTLELSRDAGTPALPYAGRPFDPGYEFYPPGTVYPRMESDGRVRFGWARLFSYLAGPPLRWWGSAGLYVWPVLGLLLACWCVFLLYPGMGPPALLAVVLVALASPLSFYGVLFWEHAPAVALALLVGCFLRRLCAGSGWTGGLAYGAGALLSAGAALALRAEMLLALMAIVLGLLPMRRVVANWRGVGLGLTVLALVVGTMWMYRWAPPGSVVGPSYRDLEATARATLGQLALGDILPMLQRVMINDPAEFGLALRPGLHQLACAGGLCVLLSLAVRGGPRVLVFAAGTLGLAAVSLWAAWQPERYRALHSLLLPVPWAAFAVWLVRAGAVGDSGRQGGRMLLFFLALYLTATTLIRASHGGPEWGARYALFFYPLAAVAAAGGWSIAWNGNPSRPARVILLVALGSSLLAGSLVLARGHAEIRETKQDLASYRDALQAQRIPVVTDLWWLPSAMPAHFEERELYVVSHPGALARWHAQRGRAVPRWMIISYAPSLAQESDSLPGARAGVSQAVRGMQFWMVEQL
jgi:hypothetical protein